MFQVELDLEIVVAGFAGIDNFPSMSSRVQSVYFQATASENF